MKRIHVGKLAFRRTFLAAAAATLIPAAVAAQAIPEPAADGISPACSADEFRQFDFWIGHWSVQGANSPVPNAENRITREAHGCFVREEYHNGQGYTGSSTNWYDRSTGQWNQLWIDNSGLVLRLAGGLDAPGKMVLEGLRVTGDGTEVTDRITWTDQGDGTVRQYWQASTDGGATWQVAFDGVYRQMQ